MSLSTPGDVMWGLPDLGFLLLQDSQVHRANPQACQWLVRQEADLIGEHLDALFTPIDDEAAASLAADMLIARNAPMRVQLNGGARTLSLRAVPVDEGATLIHLQDISEMEKTAHSLALLQTALDHSLNGYDTVDANGHFTYANRAYLDMWGYDDLSEILGQSPADHCVDPEIPGRIIADIEAKGRATWQFEAKRKDGSRFDVVMALQKSTDERGQPIYVGTSIDVTELRRLRVELGKLQRHEAIGGMAASIAHDFNNALSPILGFTELMLLDAELSEVQRDRLGKVHRAAERSSRLTSSLLAFSRQQVLEPRPTDLGEVVNDLRELLATTLRADVALELQLPETPCRILVDAAQLQNLILNLATNAQDAMPDGGKLLIEVKSREIDEEFCRQFEDFTPGLFGELCVSDTGTGITKQDRERIFEPFYTTKGNRGSGLGLASVQGIVQQHRGNLLLYSEPGMGTTFKVYFPATDAASETATREQSPDVLKGTTVLVVEDSDLLRDLTLDMLRSAGYTAYGAESGQAAQDWAAEHPLPDLLLTDVILPDTNGRKLAEALRSRAPQLAVAYISGYTSDIISHHGILHPGIHFLQKPFTMRSLLELVATAVKDTNSDANDRDGDDDGF